jgi:putative redox protein
VLSPGIAAPPARELDILPTTDGQLVRVGLTRGDANQPVSLDFGPQHGAGARLTRAEARQLAAVLLRQAAAADGMPTETMANHVEVSYLGGESYAIAARGHALLTDQPHAGGGTDTAMTPTELFVGALASCVAFYAGRYLARHGLDRDGLQVSAAYVTATDRPARIAGVRLTIHVPAGVPASRREPLLAVAGHCTVHNTLRQAPDVSIELADKEGQGETADVSDLAVDLAVQD